eukprot:11138256-Lingulodinium_polyedra.AAC.1
MSNMPIEKSPMRLTGGAGYLGLLEVENDALLGKPAPVFDDDPGRGDLWAGVNVGLANLTGVELLDPPPIPVRQNLIDRVV